MPIDVSTQIRVFGQEAFHALDQRIMAVVFEVHNEFGRLLDEALFKREIAARCMAQGLKPVEREVRIRVSRDDFSQDYAMDLLFGGGVMLEAKTVEALNPAHRQQTLNYLLLTGMRHARLVNLRTELVEHEFVSTRLSPELRRRFLVRDRDWRAVNAQSQLVRTQMLALLEDWGAFLEGTLYRDALVHFLGGPTLVNKPVEVFGCSGFIGTQNLSLLDDQTALVLTTLHKGGEQLRDHLKRLLEHTGLEHVQWINLNYHDVELTTLSKPNQAKSLRAI